MNKTRYIKRQTMYYETDRSGLMNESTGMHSYRINNILCNPLYEEYVKKNEKAEKLRIFCCHDMRHFLDVARIGMILDLNDGYGLPQDEIYAAALLHDIGRWQEYETGEDHALISSRLAPEILRECGFYEDTIKTICLAIASHRDKDVKDEKDLRGLLYRADKLSRPCFACPVADRCNRPVEKRNQKLVL